MRPSSTPEWQRRSVPVRRMVALFTALIAMSAPSVAGAIEPPGASYLYVEANEGDAAGGHVAIRFGDEVFHFQQEAGRFLRLHHDDFAHFHFVYAMLGNRPIHETQLALTRGAADATRDRFARRALVEAAQFGRRDALTSDLRFVATVCNPTAYADGKTLTRQLEAAGLFATANSGDEPVAELDAYFKAAAQRFRQQLTRESGGNLVVLQRSVEQQLRALAARVVVPQEALSPYLYPVAYNAPSATYDDAAAGLLALRLVEQEATLRPDAYVALAQDDAHLSPIERAILAEAAQVLADQLVGVTQRARPGWGPTLLLGVARLQALRASATSGRLILLDALPDDARPTAAPGGALRVEYTAELERETRQSFAAARREFFAQPGFSEADYTSLEAAAAGVGETQRLAAGAEAVRVLAQPPLPSRRAAVAGLPLPRWSPLECGALQTELQSAAWRLDAALERQYAYNLVTHNCVSEIFATLQAEQSTENGGVETPAPVIATWPLIGFIPALSAPAVADQSPAATERLYSSYRQVRLAELHDRSIFDLARLREVSTLTSTTYRPSPDDSAFILFAGEAGVARPLVGVANLAYGAVAAAAGVFAAPFDAANLFQRGVRGIAFSLPEMVFLDLRKGSTLFVEPATVQRALADH